MAIFEAIKDRDAISGQELARLAIHEAQRIFGDRLVEEVHRQWTDATLDEIFLKAFSMLSPNDLKRPLLFSSIITGNYDECDVDRLKVSLQRTRHTHRPTQTVFLNLAI